MSVAPDQVSITLVLLVPEAVKVGAVGGVVSGSNVVTFTELLSTEMFPEASLAFTLNKYVVEGVSPVTV